MELCIVTARSYIRKHCYFKKFQRISRLNCIRTEHQLNIESVKNNQESIKISTQVSTLYVPGRHGRDVYQIVKPNIDVDFIEKNIDKINHSCDSRGIEIDLQNAIPSFRKWEVSRNEHVAVVERDQEYITELQRLKSLGLTSEYDDVHRRQEESFVELKATKDKLHDVEDVAMPLFASIPNILDESTPLQADEVSVSVEAFDLGFSVVPHAELGKRTSLLEFSSISPTAYYLMGELSQLELAAETFFYERLAQSGFAPMSCTDFCKSFIIEAVGLNPHSSDDCIRIQNKYAREFGQKQNLVGGASLESFCAYLTNMNVNKSTLEVKYFSAGRRYNARHRLVRSPDLFSVVQSSNIHCLVLSDEKNEAAEFSKLFDLLFGCFLDLKIPFQIVNVAARRLNSTESRRKQIELWSPSQLKYVPVAHVSQHGDFISKRLNITYGEHHAADGYCSIVEGVAVNASVLIGCILENFQRPDHTFDTPEIWKDFFDVNKVD